MSTTFAIHIDCDPLAVYETEYGLRADRHELIYRQALPEFLDFFRQNGISATFFVIGRELERDDCRAFCREAIAQGHAIGNHTLTHPVGFAALSPKLRRREITLAHDVIGSQSGYAPVGFRAPGYSFSPDIAEVLHELDYSYDSSTLPGPAALLITAYMRAKGAARGKSFGVWSNLLARRRPHMLTARLAELPIATVPFLRLPVHTTFIYQFGRAYLWAALAALRRSRGHHVFLFHAIDLLDHPDRASLAEHLLPLRWTIGARRALVDEVSRELAPRCVQSERLRA